MSKRQFRVTYQREGERRPRKSNPIESEWTVHERARFMLDEANPHYLCDHDSNEFHCLGDVQWVRIDEREVSDWSEGEPIYKDRA